MVSASLSLAASHTVSQNGRQTLEKIIFAHELERRKWALEIHDGITQSLANIYYRLQAHKRLLSRNPSGVVQDLDELEELVTEAMTEARGIIDDLRPSILDDVGLVPALEKCLKRLEQHNSIFPTFNQIGAIPRLPCEIETAVYRIVQEALTNVSKHAKATEVKLEISFCANSLAVTVSDNGPGFDVAAVDQEGDNWGLIGMRERAEIIHGVFHIESSSGQGTSVSLAVPLGEPAGGHPW